MSAIYPLSIHRRIERQWASRMKSLESRIVIAAGNKLPRAFEDDSLIPSVEVALIVGPTAIHSLLTS
jgi:hypothetical protein